MVFLTVKKNGGFTLIELIVVLAVFSILSVVVIPRILTYLSSTRDSFLLFTTIITKTFDDAYINQRINFLVIHCQSPETETTEIANNIFERKNGLSVVNLNEKYEFVDSPNKLLKYREFPDSFTIKKVILPDGSQYENGNVFVPFYPSGIIGGAIIHILVNSEEEWTISINKYLKEPTIIKGFSVYEEVQ